MILICLMAVGSLKAQAQTITGCVIYEASGVPRLTAPIYTGAPSGTTSCNGYTVQVYASSPSVGPLNTICYTPTLPNASPALFRNCVVNGACGIVKTITVVTCPIDDYAAYMILILSTVGVFFIRKLRHA